MGTFDRGGWRSGPFLLPLLLVGACEGAPPEGAFDRSFGEDEGMEPVQGAPMEVTAFVGVHVLPMDGDQEVLQDQVVLIRDGRVVEVGPVGEVAPPAEARVVEGEDRWLLPGLSEMHAHIPGPGAPDEVLEDLLFLYLANGITTIRGMLGAPNHLELREATASGQVLGPTIFAASPSLSGDAAPDPETAEEAVRGHAAAGYDLLKLHPGLHRAVYDRIVEVAREEGITWAGHVSTDVGLEHALATGKSTVDHLDGYVEAAPSPEVRARIEAGEAVTLGEIVESVTEERIRELAEVTASAGTWNVPTIYLWENFYNDVPADQLRAQPEMRYATDQQLDQWSQQKDGRVFVDLLENWRTDGELGAEDVSHEDAQGLIELRRRILAALDEAGAGILMGTDSPQMFMVPGFAVHREMDVMARAGMSPHSILRSGSRNVAEYARDHLGYDEDFGRVTPGARADLILVTADPLDDLDALRDPAGVMVRGRWLPAEEIRARLESISRE